jgi:BexC/CtrB/KpsE family polysaccharide export inner-membrane protein
MSRDALRELDRNQAYRKAYTSNSISVFDRFNPLGWSGSFEELYHYYEGKINVDHDSTSSITTLSVRAYSPATAQQVNRRLLEMAEATVNRLNDRARADLIRVASSEVDAAENRSRAAALALSAFRNRAGVVDPEKQATVQLQMVSKLQDELIATRAQLAQMRKIAPENSQIEVLEAQVRSLSSDIDAQTGKVAGNRNSLSSSAAQPNLPDHATEPRRLRGILATFLLGLVAFGILSMLIAGIREHQD